MQRPFISFWFGVQKPDAQTFDLLQEAGYTVPMVAGSVQENLAMLDLCAERRMKALVVDSRLTSYGCFSVLTRDPFGRHQEPGVEGDEAEIRRRCEGVVRDYSAHPALWGYMVSDEPHASQFAAIGIAVRWLRRLDRRHVPYVNLFPDYATPEQLGINPYVQQGEYNPTQSATQRSSLEIYREHLRQYTRLVPTPWLSYDHYALWLNGSVNPGYFGNMRAIVDESLRTGRPWIFIYMVSQYAPEAVRLPSEADMRWQAFTSLAMGAAGLSHFTKEDALNVPERRAMIRRVNTASEAVLTALRGWRWAGARHSAPVPANAGPQDGLPGWRVECDGEWMAGRFTRGADGRRLLLVNRSWMNALRCTVSAGNELIRAYHSDTRRWTARRTMWQGELAAGDCVLLEA